MGSFITEENVPRVDPMIPHSTGGLLAEEWTIDPDSALPSFLEMTMMDEARRSGLQSLKWVSQQIEQRLLQMETDVSSSSLWKQIRSKCAVYVARNILRPYGPEIRFLVMYFLQRKSILSKSTATISEALYGGKRVKLAPSRCSTSNQRELMPMSKQDGVRLALLVSLGPYLAERCEIIYNNLSKPSQKLPLKIKKILKIVYPFLHMSVQGIHLLFRWRYLMGQSFFFDGYSRYLNLVVRRITMEDQESAPETQTDMTDGKHGNILKDIFGSKKVRQVAAGIIASVSALGWLARIRLTRREIELQTQSRQLQSRDKDEYSFPPHPPPIRATEPNAVRTDPTLCPLCRLPRVNPTASTSGYVFCLKCILSHIRTSSATCPVTGKSCPESSLLQLFEPHLP